MKLLVISNGHGEDLVGAELIKKLPAGFEISALPIIGEGKAYEGHCEILGPRKNLPGGGFSLRNFSSFLEDVKEGYLSILWEHYRILKCQNPDLVVGIGDIVPMVGARIAKAPLIFIGVNKTDYYKWFGYSYTPWEIWFLKSAEKVFTRDRMTAQNLSAKGIKAEFVGNPLMDTLKDSRLKTKDQRLKTIGLLPGTREKDVELNTKDFEEIKEEIEKIDNSIKFNIAGRENFEEVLKTSTLVIGLSGTGNEQAAGMGIPVISFPGLGSQYNKKFGEAQCHLLGEALIFIRNRDFPEIARKTVELMNNSQLRSDMGRIGQARMGGFGAIEKIAQFIIDEKHVLEK